MRNILILLLLVCTGVYAQDVQNIDADTAKVAKSGYNRISIKTGKLFFRGLTGTKKEVVSTNNSYSNPAWIPSLALAKVTGLQDSLSNSVKKIAGKSLSANDYTSAEKTKLAGIATGATANSADATLLSRANHTGTQLSNTISDFNTAADARVVAGITGKANLAGDNTFTGTQTFRNILPEVGNTYNIGSGTAYFNNTYFQTSNINNLSGNQASFNIYRTNGNGINIQNATTIFARIFETTGNFLLQNGGTFTDTGEKLQVNGTSKFTDVLYTQGGTSIFQNSSRFGNTVLMNAALYTNSLNSTTLNSIYLATRPTANVIAVQHWVGVDSQTYWNTSNGSYNWQASGVNRMTLQSTGELGIGTTLPTALLDVTSTTKGSMPFPRMTSTQRLAIASPAIGLHVYQTDGTEGVYVYKSAGWAFAY